MTETHPLETILRQCAATDPEPWYPSAFAQATGTPRDSLDPHLDRLRLGGLIRLTDWVEGRGQGYVLTPEGHEVLANPRLLRQLCDGRLPLRTDGPRPREPPVHPLHAGTWERGEAAREALLHPPTPVVTRALIFINLAVFLAGLALASSRGVRPETYLAGNDPETLAAIGAVDGADIYLHHQWWRLLTCCFVHIGWIHLAVNVYSLYICGPQLEAMWGSWRFLVLYLLAGFGAGCGIVVENPIGGGAGASGAIWGIVASMAVWLLLHRRVLPPPWRAQQQSWLVSVFLLNLFVTFFIPGISKAGHFVGGAVGLVAAFPLDYLRFGRGRQRWLAVAGLAAIALLCLGVLTQSLKGKAGLAILQGEVLRQRDDFLHNEVPAIRETIDTARKAYEDRLEAGDPKEKAQALATARADAEKVAARLSQAEPVSDVLVMEARKEGRSCLDAWVRLLELAEKHTAAGNRAENEDDLEQQEQRVHRAEQDWVEAVSRVAEP